MAQKLTDKSSLIPEWAARTFLALLHQLQKIDSEFPIQYAICLSEISLNEGCSLTTLAEKTGLSLSTISRIVGALSDFRQNGEPYGLIELKVSPEERRRKEIYLTAKGRQTLQKITKIIESAQAAA
ncbi:MAG: winged helix-turn-helix transcriptional regulator [Alphaproteobacteria bacterium]|jgi:DNA-binding MarR family transcriptional regulator|nr:winged helix-turn-helix transcriptional regulator [Alphaproteobacteria bacterium]